VTARVARLALLLGLLAAAGASRAEIVRSEGEGAALLAAAGGAAPHAAALQAALRDAALRVATGLSGRAPSEAARAALEAALGPEPARFAQGYRELGQYERPGPGGRELVVQVEARIDAAGVADALRQAGLLAATTAPGGGASGRVVVEPLPDWPSLEAVLQRLVELGARRAAPERAEPGRVVLAIESDRSEGALVAALVASPPPGVTVRSTGDRNGMPAIRLERAPEVLQPIDTPAAKR